MILRSKALLELLLMASRTGLPVTLQVRNGRIITPPEDSQVAGIERYKGAAPIDPLKGKPERAFYFYLSEDHQMYTFYAGRSCGEAIEKFTKDKQFELWQVTAIEEDRK